MLVIRKAFAAVLLLSIVPLVTPYAVAGDYLYIPEHDNGVVDDAKGRQILKDIPGLDLAQVWFVTGAEYKEESDTKCVRARDLWLFSKPRESSPGIWRGKQAYFDQFPESQCSKTMQTTKRIDFDADTVTFTDPDDLHPEEARDGQVPGVFLIHDGITDNELTKLQTVIAQVRACLKGNEKCSYPISKEGLHMTKQYDLTPAIKVTQLLTMSIRTEYYGSGKPCYSMIFAQDNPWEGAVGMSICYRNEAVSKVELDDEIVE